MVQQKNWEMLRDERTHRPSGIWVVTFPKCGTTLMEQILVLLRNGGSPTKADPQNKNLFDEDRGEGKIWPEVNVQAMPVSVPGKGKGKGKGKSFFPLEKFEKMPGQRLLKTHA